MSPKLPEPLAAYFAGVNLHDIDGMLVSRDLLDSINELTFLDDELGIAQRNMTILDIGAGYGRLAHRATTAFENLTYLCTDAIPLSSRDVVCPIVPMFHVCGWSVPYVAAMNGAKLEPCILGGAATAHKRHQKLHELHNQHRGGPRQGGLRPGEVRAPGAHQGRVRPGERAAPQREHQARVGHPAW